MKRADGYREPGSPDLPDVALTGDEFLHVLALWGELIPGAPRCHDDPEGVPGQPEPGCAACEALLTKGEAHMLACEPLIGGTHG